MRAADRSRDMKLAPLLFVTAIACGPSEPEITGDPLIEIGTGDADSFAALPDEGAELELSRGTQGGFHVDLALRIQGIDPDGMTLSWSLRDRVTGAALGPDGSFSLRRRRLEEKNGTWIRVGDRAVLDIGDPNQVVGSSVRLTAMLVGNGAMLEDRVDGAIIDSR
jgi:hypothetical protein